MSTVGRIRNILRITSKPVLSIFVLAGLGVLCLGYAYFIEPNRLVVRHEELKVSGWDPAFDGFRIAMIGDIHGGSNGVTEEKLREIVRLTNDANVDLVVLLGDYVSQFGRTVQGQRPIRMPITTIADNLAGFRSANGVMMVLGNHDGWHGDTDIAAQFTRVGYRVLQNEVVVIERGQKKLRFLGLKDHMKVTTWKAYSDAAKAAAAPTEGAGDLVVLEHAPDILPLVTGDLAISNDLKLFLAAHTHGGQVWFPILGRPVIPSSYGQKYGYGHVKDRGVDMWVTGGIGTSILPLRFMVPPEITVLTIKAV